MYTVFFPCLGLPQLGLPKSGQEMSVQLVMGLERAVLGDVDAIRLRR
jgi:hypothetical protein